MSEMYDLDLNDEEPGLLADLLDVLTGLAGDADSGADPAADDELRLASDAVLARLHRNDFGSAAPAPMASVIITGVDARLRPAAGDGPPLVTTLGESVPALESAGYKPEANITVGVNGGEGTADIIVTLHPATAEPEHLRTSVTAPDGSVHTARVDREGTSLLCDVPFPFGAPVDLHFTWYRR